VRVCSFTVWRVVLYWNVRSQFGRLQAAGFPVSGAELNAWRPSVLDEENGALVLGQAFALLRNFPDGRSNELAKTEWPNRTNEWSKATRDLVTDYVQRNTPALAKVREGLKLPKFRYPVDFSYGPEAELPHLRNLNQLAHIAALQTELEVENEKNDEWPKQVLLQLNLAGTLDDEPLVVSHGVRELIIRLAVKASERSLSRATPSAEVCKLLQSAFARAGETNLLPKALIGERAMMIPAFRLSWQEMQSFKQDEQSEDRPRRPQRFSGNGSLFLWFSGFFERDLNFYMKTMERSWSLASLPPPQSLALTNYMETAGIVARKRLYILSALVLPTLGKITLRDAAVHAQMEIAATALAVERFRHDRHGLPENLGELTPQFLDAVPKDPFAGADLRYRRLPTGYVIYSIGADGHDDRGRQAPERRPFPKNTSYDITFIVDH
jgi:hypothetical protein